LMQKYEYTILTNNPLHKCNIKENYLNYYQFSLITGPSGEEKKPLLPHL
jgi:hypothetical protein